MRFLIAILLLAALPVAATAETAYVTDILRLGLHKAEDTSDRAFKTLQSGQEMEILARGRNYAQVRLPDGTLGFVKVAYLVTEKPAKLIVAQTLAVNAELERKLADLNAAFSQPAATIATLEQEGSERQVQLDDAENRIGELRQNNDDLRRQQSRYKYSLPVSWVGGALVVCLLAGFLGGLWWTDQRSRKRHGGIRIY